jgi:hypothetical protein
MSIDQQARHRFGPASRLDVPLGCGHDRALTRSSAVARSVCIASSTPRAPRAGSLPKAGPGHECRQLGAPGAGPSHERPGSARAAWGRAARRRPMWRIDRLGTRYWAPVPGPLMPVLIPSAFAAFIYCLTTIWRAKHLDRRERRAFLVSFSVYIVFAVNDILHGARLIQSVRLFDYAFVILALGLAYLVVRRFSLLSGSLEIYCRSAPTARRSATTRTRGNRWRAISASTSTPPSATSSARTAAARWWRAISRSGGASGEADRPGARRPRARGCRSYPEAFMSRPAERGPWKPY